MPGWLAWTAAGIVAVVGGLALLVQSPPATRWGRDWLIRQVASQWQLDLATTRLDLDPLARRVTLYDVRLAAPGHDDDPFFSAARVSASLPWAVFRGRVRVDVLEVDGGRVHLVREGGVMVNLPPSSGKPPPEVPRRLDLRNVRVSWLDVVYEDRTADSDVSVRGLRLMLDERQQRGVVDAAGTIAAEWLHVRLGARATTSGAWRGGAAFDGSHLALDGLTVPLPEARVVADGHVRRVLDDTHFELALTGTLDYARLSAWTPPPVPVSGTGSFTGSFTGPFNAYVLKADFASPGLTIARAEGLPLTGHLELTSPRTVIQPFRITMPATAVSPREGVVEGRFTYEFGASSSDMAATFRDVDLDRALAAYNEDPTTFAAWQDGTVTIRVASPAATMELHARGTSKALTRAERIAIDGTWKADLVREQWRVEHDHRLLDTVRASGSMAWPSADEPSRSPLSGPLAVEIANVGPMVRAARQSGVDLSPWLMDVTGPASGKLAMDGTMARMVIRGKVESSALRLPTGAAATAVADIVYDLETLQATPFEFTTPGATLTGDVLMGMESSALEGSFRASATDLPQLAAPLASLPTLSGVVNVQGTIGGTTDVPDVPFTVQSTPIGYDGQRVGTVDVDARLRGTTVEFARLSVHQDPGTFTGRGRVDYESGAYDVAVEGHDLQWRNPVEGAPVEALTAQVAFSGAGTFDAPGGAGTLAITPVGGSIGEFIGPTDVRWQFAAGLVNATAFLPKLRTFVQATASPRAPYAYQGVAAVSALDVQPLLLAIGGLPEAVSGTVGASVAFSGRGDEPASAEATVNLQSAELSVGGLPVRLERAARATVRLDDFTIDDLAVRAGATTLQASGRYRDGTTTPLTAALDGRLGDVVALGRAFGAVPPGVAADGRIEGRWESRGGIEQARATLRLTDASVTPEGLPALTALTTTAVYDGAVVTVDALRGEWQGAVLEGTARLPRPVLTATAQAPAPTAGRVDLTLRGITQQALAPWLPASTVSQTELKVAATLGLDVTSPTLDGLRGALVVDQLDVVAAGVPISQTHPSRLGIAGRTISFDDVTFSAGTPVVFGGRVTLLEEPTFDLTVTGTPGLRPFSVLSPAMSVDGAATVDLHVTGTTSAPRVDGRVDLDDAEVVMRNPSVIASDISGPLVFEGDRVSVNGVKGFLNGGEFELSGGAQVLGVDVMSGQVTAQVRGVALEYPVNVDSEIDAILTFSPGPGQPLLSGDMRVQRASYRAAISLPALLALGQTRPTARESAASYSERVRLDVAVTTVDDIAIDNNYGRIEAGANLRVQGTAARPGATGRIDLREGGELYVLGGLYRLNESSISLTNPSTIAPDLNISAVTNASGGEDTLTLSGTLDRLTTNVTSSNPDARQNTLDVLLRTNSLNREDALALLSGELLGVGRALGLDSVRVDRGYDVDTIFQDAGQLAAENQDPTTRLTLSKRVSPDVEVIISQDLSKSGLTGVVSYRPWRGLELRGTQRDNSDRNYAIRHQITFGAVPAPASTKRQLPDVGAVEIDGVPADEPALRRLLKMTPGKTFDFIDWREDIDRLRAWYHDRRRLEARVRASRSERPDGTVALAYRIIPGPETLLELERVPVSKGLRRALENAWTGAVYDRFLTDELRWLVQLELIRRNVIDATVNAEVVESTPERKVARLSVINGTQAEARRVRYTGAKTLGAADFATQVRAFGISEYVWMEPLAIVRPITDLYYAIGYRHAVVDAKPVRLDGTTAVLDVTIDEGPPTLVGAVTFEGVDEALREPVTTAARLFEGQVYADANADDARRRIESVYRSRGYNNVAVTPAVTADEPTHTVAITFSVAPGAQQRLAEVVVDGARITRDSAVTSALGLKPGTPVDFAAWAQARKRVYDTNVFRQVDVQPEVIPGGDGATEQVRARVTVTEWPEWRLRYGLQLDDALATTGEDVARGRTRQVGVTADLQNRNVFGRAFTFGVTGRAEKDLRSSSTYFTFPTLFGRAVQTNVFASVQRRELALVADTNDYRQDDSQLSIEQRIRRGTAFQLAYGYRVKRSALLPIDPEELFQQRTLFGRFTASIFGDRRDNPFDAKRGWFGALNAERVTEFESGADTIKLLTTAYGYRTFGRLTFASAARVGLSFLDELVFTDRFYVGGADTVRGYAEDAAGPKNLLGIARGGNAMLLLNQELRASILTWARAVAFVDAGNVFLDNRDMSFGNLQVGYGLGLRFDTPFSIFRIDVGWPTKGPRGARWYFGLGQIF